MKLLVIGCGQCGSRIADEFARLNGRARLQRGIDIVTGSFAVNTDIADLTGLSYIRPDQQHRILIGGQKTGGHGVGKINEVGAEIIREDGGRVLEAIKTTRRFHETDAFLLVASSAGGTGSGAIPLLTQYLKERYVDKPIYNLIVLPFKHEEKVEERTIYNTATCLKSAYLVADAIFLVHNQNFIRKDYSIQNNLARINTQVVEPFYNLLCAGEEKKPKYIGSRVVDAGDIIQTLWGWTVIGYGKTEIPLFKLPFKISNFREQTNESQKGMRAMNDAINDLSLKCNTSEAKRALYLLSAPHNEMNMSLIHEIGTSLKQAVPQAIIRSGDYPREKHSLNVTLILSEIASVGKIMEYFTKSIHYISAHRKRWDEIEYEPRGIEEAFRDIPSLL